MANRNYPKVVTATTIIPFDNPVTYIPPKTVTGAVAFTKNTTGAQAGYSAIIEVIADGVNVPDLSAFYSVGTGAYDNTAGVINLLTFFYTGQRYCVAVNPISGTGGAGDTTPPGIITVSISTGTPNVVDLAYGETLDSGSVPATSAYTITVNGTTRTISGVTISGSSVHVTFGGAAVVSGDSVTLDYAVPGTNPVQDVAGNDAGALTGVIVDNGVSSGTPLNAPTGVTLGSPTSTTQPLTWTDTNTSPNENGYKVYKNTANNFSAATLVTTTAANATSYTVTGLTASTLYYYWVVAAGNGTTTSDSSPSTVASGSTASGSVTITDVAYTYHNPSLNTSKDFSATPCANGDPIAEIRDQIRLSNPGTHPFNEDLQQSDATKQPTYVAAGINGKPTIETNYTGGNAKFLGTAIFGTSLVPVFEKWLVFELKTAVTGFTYITLGGQQFDITINSSTGKLSVYCGGSIVDTTYTVAVDTPFIVRAIFRAGTVDVYVNGASVGTGLAAGSDTFQNRFDVGANDATCPHGWYRQYITIDHELSSTDATSILNILKTDNGIA